MTDALNDPHHEREAARLTEMAIRKGWVIPEAAAELLPKKALARAFDEKLSDRTQLGWAKVLVAMDRTNEAARANDLRADALGRVQSDNHLHLHGGPSAAEIARELLAHDGFVEASRQETARRVGTSPINNQSRYLRGDD